MRLHCPCIESPPFMLTLSRNQIKELAQPTRGPDGRELCIFSAQGLKDIHIFTTVCEAIFIEIGKELSKASKQISGKKGQDKIVLSASEKAKWPFLQPRIKELRLELGESKNNLILMLSVTTLAHAERLRVEYGFA